MAIPQPLTGLEYRFAVAFTKAIAYLQTTAYSSPHIPTYKNLYPKIVTKAEEGQEPAYWNLLPGKNYEDAIILANPLPDTTESEEWCILPTGPRLGDKGYAKTLVGTLDDQGKIDHDIIVGFNKQEYEIAHEYIWNSSRTYDRTVRDMLEAKVWSAISRDYLIHIEDTMPIKPETIFYIPGHFGELLQEVTRTLKNLPGAVLEDHNGWNRRAMEIVDRARAQMGIPVGLDDIPEEDFIFGDYTDALNVLKAADKREFEAKKPCVERSVRASRRPTPQAVAKQRHKVQRAMEEAEVNDLVVDDVKGSQVPRKRLRRDLQEAIKALVGVGSALSFIIVFWFILAIIFAVTHR